jgi:hypothetical protein
VLAASLKIDPNWNEQRVTFIPRTGISDGRSRLDFLLESGTVLWIDDISLVGDHAVAAGSEPALQPRVASAGNKNLVPNASFE